MKYNKAVWSGALSVASGLVFILTIAQPYLPTKIGVPIGIILLIAIPVVTYLVPNFDRIKADAEKVLKDAKTGNVTAVVHDGALFVREDLEPALTAGQVYRQKVAGGGSGGTSNGSSIVTLSGVSGLIGDVDKIPAVAKAVPELTEVTTEIPKVEQAVHAAQAGLSGIAKLTNTPIADEALAAVSKAAPVVTEATAAVEKVEANPAVVDVRKALGL